MGTQSNLAIAPPEEEGFTQPCEVMHSYEVSDIREDGASALSGWMTKLLLNKEFQMVPANNLQAIFSRLEPMTFLAGQNVIAQGEPGNHFFVITAGRCVVTRELPLDRGEVTLAELTVGDTFGEEALITNATRQATITMITHGAVMRLDKDDFRKLLSEPIVSVVEPDEADAIILKGGEWLNVDFAENSDAPDPPNTIRIPTYLLRLKLEQLDSSQQYVVVSRKYSHACAAAHILRQNGFDVYVLACEGSEGQVAGAG